MNITTDAIYEEGVLKPTQPINLAEGCRVSLVIEINPEVQSKQSPAAILEAIATLPLESDDLVFSNQDHDQELYVEGNQ
ncbi:MAG: antitoxin family protein [Thermostichus sp. BF3_bins_97]